MQADGKFVVVKEWAHFSEGVIVARDFSVARFNADGTLDTSFGPDGTGSVRTNFSGYFEYPEAVAIQVDGKIVVVGTTDAEGPDFAVARYLANGQPDATFGGRDGEVTTDFGGGEHAYAIAIQNDGKIVVIGESRAVGHWYRADFAIARYNEDGSLDSTFAGDGKVTTNFGGTESAKGVAMQSDGKIVVAGSTNGSFALARYDTDGRLDTSFDRDGKLTTSFPGMDSAGARGVVIQSDSKMVAAGVAAAHDWMMDGDFALVRYNPDGSPDLSFGTLGTGQVITDLGSGLEGAYGIILGHRGKLLVAGTSGGQFALARYNFGLSGQLRARSSTASGLNREIYLKFDLGSLSTISTAKLRLFGRVESSTSESNPVAVYPVSGTSWTQTGITWNNRPASGALALAMATVTSDSSRWYEWDLAAYLQSEKAAGRNVVSLVLKSTVASLHEVAFNSAQTSSNRPELLIVP